MRCQSTAKDKWKMDAQKVQRDPADCSGGDAVAIQVDLLIHSVCAVLSSLEDKMHEFQKEYCDELFDQMTGLRSSIQKLEKKLKETEKKKIVHEDVVGPREQVQPHPQAVSKSKKRRLRFQRIQQKMMTS